MKYLPLVATVSLLLSAMPAGAAPSYAPFSDETPQQREARKADIRDRDEREERAREIRNQREIEHPEIMYDEREHDEDIEE